MNPIIETIDEGHVQHGLNCVKCQVPYPCAPILQARKDNENYVPIPATPAPLFSLP